MLFHNKKFHIGFRGNQKTCPKFRQGSLRHLGRRKSLKAPCRWFWPPKMSWLVSYLWVSGTSCLANLLQSCRSITYILLIRYPGLPFGTCCVYVHLGRMQKQKKPPKNQKNKTPRYLCLAWIYEEVRKCIFNVYEFLPWPCEATAVLVHKQHDEVSYYQTERPQLHAGGCFCLSFHASSRNLSAKPPHGMCYAYLWFIDDNHGASHL